MEQITNYKDFLKELDSIKEENIKNNKKAKLLIHACCAPCSSEVLEVIKDYFDITIYYYNPNIFPKDEYDKRYNEFNKLPKCFNIVYGEYEENKYNEAVKGLENLGEFSKRCYNCFEFRLDECAKYAYDNKFDFFTTTLSISPFKNSKWINEIGYKMEEKYKVKYLYSDFKKQEGYKKSIKLSKEYNLYRQEYCGCKYSLSEAKEKTKDTF